MKPLKLIFTILILSLLVASCTEKIDVQLDSGYTRLVVDGSITTDTMVHTVTLSSSSSYFYDQPAPPVKGAQLSITDGSQTFNLTGDSNGVYRTEPSVYGIPGHTYTLNIKLANPIGGHSEYSATSTLHPVHALDSITLSFHPDWMKKGVWEVKCYVLEPPTTDFYRFMVYKNDKLISDSLNEWLATDDKFINGNYTKGVSVAYLRQGSSQENLVKGDKVTIEVDNIGEGYYNFIMEAQAEIRGSNPLFSGPPANVKGNINNGGIGYFAAYSNTLSSAITPAF